MTDSKPPFKRFTHSNGTEFVFGATMDKTAAPREAPNAISWNDPKLNEWEATSSNQAGCIVLTVDFHPCLVFECDRRVVAYQRGLCVELEYIGGLFVWNSKILAPGFMVTNTRALAT